MTRHLITLLAIATLLLGCTQEEQNHTAVTTTAGEPVVTFLAAANDPTRGTAMSGSFDTNASFRVYATVQQRVGDAPKAGTVPQVFINGDVVSYQRIPAHVKDGYIWVWKTDADYLWPQDNYMVTFYAIHPASAPQMTGFPATKSFAYTGGEGGQLIDGDTDLMYAYVQTHRDDNAFTSVTANVDDNSTVALRFHHLLSQVAFYGKLSNLFSSFGWTVEVGGITLHNINAAGTYDFGSASAPTLTLSNPSVAHSYSMHIASANGVTVNSTSAAVPLTSTTDVIMLLPQNPTRWNPATETIATTSGCYLAIQLRIVDQDGHYHLGAADRYDVVYVPFETGVYNDDEVQISWQHNKRYLYTLVFGGGYDDQGKPVIQPISMTTAIEPWQMVTEAGEARHQRNTN